MEVPSPEIGNRCLEIEQKRILMEMEAEQEASEEARKKAREKLADRALSNQTATAKALASLSHIRSIPNEVGINGSWAPIATCSIDTLERLSQWYQYMSSVPSSALSSSATDAQTNCRFIVTFYCSDALRCQVNFQCVMIAQKWVILWLTLKHIVRFFWVASQDSLCRYASS